MNTISILQIIVAVALIVLILLQQRDADISGFLGGGGGGGGFYQQRRGLERLFFALTIVLTIVFAALALTSLFYAPTPSSTDTNASSTPAQVTASTTTPVINILPSSSTPKK
jgi:protein translocase SecG subunit